MTLVVPLLLGCRVDFGLITDLFTEIKSTQASRMAKNKSYLGIMKELIPLTPYLRALFPSILWVCSFWDSKFQTKYSVLTTETLFVPGLLSPREGCELQVQSALSQCIMSFVWMNSSPLLTSLKSRFGGLQNRHQRRVCSSLVSLFWEVAACVLPTSHYSGVNVLSARFHASQTSAFSQ